MDDIHAEYEYIERGAIRLQEDLRAETLGWHQGSLADFKKRSEEVSAKHAERGRQGVKELAPYILGRIADPRMLRLAWEHICRHGGDASGLDGRRAADYPSADAWELARTLGRLVRTGAYRPGKEKTCQIPKSSGNGTRPIVLLNVQDRMVQRAATTVLQSIFDPLFHPCSFGFRPEKGHLRALATAQTVATAERRFVWVVADIKDAFLHVPVSRLLDVVRAWLPAADLIHFLEHVLPAKRGRGLRQGGALSPLMANLYLHHFLDRKWHLDSANPPLVRVADDILLLCHSADEAQTAYVNLRRFLDPAGMPLKLSADESTYDLSAGASIPWLGFAISKAKRGFLCGLTPRAWARLEVRYALAHTKPDAPLRALAIAKAWLSQRCPAYYSSPDKQAVCKKVIRIASAHAFDEMPTVPGLLNHWQLANARWQRLRNQLATEHKKRERGEAGNEATRF